MARRSQHFDSRGELVARRGPGNRRLPRGKREEVLASRTAAALLRPSREGGVGWVYPAVGWLVLVPGSWITTRALASGFLDSMGQSLWQTAAFWFFGLGLLLWSILFWCLPRPVWLYVWAHEMTHAIFTILCGGRVSYFHVTAQGGHVLTDKNNVLIALSPYFVPLYAVILVPLCLLVGTFYDLTQRIGLPGGFGFRPLWGVFLLMGVSWGFHATFTLWMMGKDQPDLRIHGVFFSTALIYLVNALLLALLLTGASPELSAGDFWRSWWGYAEGVGGAIGAAVKGVWAAVG